jgi:CBS-domain-containing membrane protein
VVTTAPEVDHTVAARLMETRGVKRLPVVDVDGRVVGIISRSDIMTSFARPDELIEDEIQVDILDRILWTEPGAVTVEVVDGRVTLHGLVPKKSDSRILEELSKRLDGVVGVNVEDVYYTIDDTRAGQASGGAPLALW